MEENNIWESFKQKKIENLNKELEVFLNKLDKIRSNRVSLEVIRGLIVTYQGERKPIKMLSSLRILPSHELVIQAFESKTISLIIKSVLDSQLGYRLVNSNKQEAYFALTPITQEIRDRLIREVKVITEEGRAALRRVRDNFRSSVKREPSFSQDQKKNYEVQIDKLTNEYQTKLIAAEKKKIEELSS